MGYTAITERNTLETKIKMSLTFDTEKYGLEGSSGVGFFDHMLNSLAIHSGAHITLQMSGDLNVDCHHTIEDVGIVLGGLIADVAKNRAPLARYGTAFIPMDEALARCVMDISGRPYLVCDYQPKSPMIGDFDTQMVKEFFRAVAFNMGATVHLSVLYGDNDHHMAEALFKAFAHALAHAVKPKAGAVLSAKGTL